jgi:hypothetical protein
LVEITRSVLELQLPEDLAKRALALAQGVHLGRVKVVDPLVPRFLHAVPRRLVPALSAIDLAHCALVSESMGTNGRNLLFTHDPKDKTETLSPVLPKNRHTMFFGSSLCMADREAISAVWELVIDVQAGLKR